MKSMNDMVDDMWHSAKSEREKTGGEYPKVIPMFPGIAVFCHSKEEEDKLYKQDLFGVLFFTIGMGLVTLCFVVAIIYHHIYG